jgi:hypothetical protein
MERLRAFFPTPDSKAECKGNRRCLLRVLPEGEGPCGAETGAVQTCIAFPSATPRGTNV